MSTHTRPASPGDADDATHDPQAARELLRALRCLMTRMGHTVSEDALLAEIPLTDTLDEALIVRIAHQQGFEGVWQNRSLRNLPDLLLPCLVMRAQDRAAVLLTTGDGQATLILPEIGEEPVKVSHDALQAGLNGRILLLKPMGDRASTDARAGIDALLGQGHWFWRVISHFKAYYIEAAVAAVLVNILALASVFFTMNVYDRVVGNQAYTTLWTLAIGVMVALGFEFALRNLRAWLLDSAGRKADLLLGSALFRQVLATRLQARPASAGAFANQMREYESLRDFATSTVLIALSDLPFVLMFLVVLHLTAGPLMLVPALAVPLLLTVALIAQRPLARHTQSNLRESSVRHGLLIEAIDSAETLKALRAEGRMLARHEQASAITAQTSGRARLLTATVLNLHGAVSTVSTVAMVVWGVHLIGAGELTQGALIGAVMLCGRTLAPLAAASALAMRLQQARVSYRVLDQIMSRPTDRESGKTYAQRALRDGHLDARDVKFAYQAQSGAVLRGLSFSLRRGETLAIVGRVGSGKTTLLKLLAGLYTPDEGSLLIDGVDLRQIDPAEYRRTVLYVGQQAQLFHGSLRENLKLGAPFASDQQMMQAAAEMGVHSFAQQHPQGYDLMIAERGENLSGGQRQAIALARAMLVDADVLLLDEPTSAMDAGTEAQALQALLARARARQQTVVIVTHKLPLLDHFERVMVIDHGQRAADGPREAVLQAMREGRVRSMDPGTLPAPQGASAQGVHAAPTPSTPARPAPRSSVQLMPVRGNQASPGTHPVTPSAPNRASETRLEEAL